VNRLHVVNATKVIALIVTQLVHAKYATTIFVLIATPLWLYVMSVIKSFAMAWNVFQFLFARFAM